MDGLSSQLDPYTLPNDYQMFYASHKFKKMFCIYQQKFIKQHLSIENPSSSFLRYTNLTLTIKLHQEIEFVGSSQNH